MPDPVEEGRTGFAGAVATIVHAWAILGGIVLVTVVLINVISVIGGVLWKPFPGDFELTEIGCAVAAFAFLPYCQLTGANVTADIFTSGISPRSVEVLKCIASLIAFLFGLLLLWRMWHGMLDQKTYGYRTAIVEFQIWWSFVPILVSLALLALASLVTMIESGQRVRGARSHG